MAQNFEEYETRLKEWILPQTINSGCFGKNVELLSFLMDRNEKVVDQFGSEITFVSLQLKKDEYTLQTYDVVIKTDLFSEEMRDYMKSSLQFHNEVLMYNKLLSLLENDKITEDMFCKYYYGYYDPDDPFKNFIVLEDLRKYGYRLAIEPLFLDYTHCVLTMTELGKFHALSYLIKSKDAIKQFSLEVSKIKETWTEKKLTKYRKMYYLCAKRGMQPLIEEGESKELIINILKQFEDPANLFNKLTKPIEPEAVLCHGDFNRNNILYRYDDNLKPIGVKFMDLQTPRYSSPVIDLSFFLLMNTTQSFRKQHLNDLLKEYKRSLIDTVDTNTMIPELDFGRVAIYGYFHCSFFLPAMLSKHEGPKQFNTDPEYVLKRNLDRGGEEATNALVNIIKDLVEFGYLKELL